MVWHLLSNAWGGLTGVCFKLALQSSFTGYIHEQLWLQSFKPQFSSECGNHGLWHLWLRHTIACSGRSVVTVDWRGPVVISTTIYPKLQVTQKRFSFFLTAGTFSFGVKLAVTEWCLVLDATFQLCFSWAGDMAGSPGNSTVLTLLSITGVGMSCWGPYIANEAQLARISLPKFRSV